MMFGNPVAWSVYSLPDPQWADGVRFGRWKSRVRGIPEVIGQLPLACLAEEVDTPGDGQIKALVTIAGNPVISAPDAGRLDRALPKLECMISLDNYMNETTRHAHVILPGLSALEQPHFDDLIAIWAVRSAGNFSPAVFPPADGRPEEWEILARLAAIIAGMRNEDVDVASIDDGFFSALCMARGIDADAAMSHYQERGPLRLLDLQIRTGPFGDRYGERPRPHSAVVRGAAARHRLRAARTRLREILATPSGKLELAPDYITADVPRLRARLDRDDDGLLLVSRRHLRSNNSWMHNIERLVSGKDRCTLLIHPTDAAAAGVTNGVMARVTSSNGSIEAPVEVSDEMMPGVVSLPHGWGHDKAGARLTVAREHAGVNNNLLAGADMFDPVSNNAAINGIPVTVEPRT
jgi:anaerobic selenocysteine-containing dehydrogenase